MWIFTDKGYVSLVVDKHDSDMLQVRARVKEDITRNFPGADVYAHDGADYRYRARVKRAEVALVMAQQVMDMDYTGHFKDVALRRTGEGVVGVGSPGTTSRHTAYYAVWSAMGKLQDYAPYSKYPRGQEPKWSGTSGSYYNGGSLGYPTSGRTYRNEADRWFGLDESNWRDELEPVVDTDKDIDWELEDAILDLETRLGQSALDAMSEDEWEELLEETVKENRIKQAEKDRSFDDRITSLRTEAIQQGKVQTRKRRRRRQFRPFGKHQQRRR